MKIFRWKLMGINKYNLLYGTVHAAYFRLLQLKVARDKTMHAVEKDQILSLLKEAKNILNN
jgi:hypothetical protein